MLAPTSTQDGLDPLQLVLGGVYLVIMVTNLLLLWILPSGAVAEVVMSQRV